MITQCYDADAILKLIGDDVGKCLYIYIDLIKYGTHNDFFKIWIQTDDKNEPVAVISKYYNGLQIFIKKVQYDVEELSEFISSQDYSMIVGMEQTLSKLNPLIDDCIIEKGYVGQMNGLTFPPDPRAYRAAYDEIEDIVELISADEALGGPYEADILSKQFMERFDTSFGRSYLLRDKTDDSIIAHAATYAETDDIAVISGVITAPLYRGKGYSKGVLAALCSELLAENKSVFSYYYIPAAIKMHHGVGFVDIGQWAKLVRKKEC